MILMLLPFLSIAQQSPRALKFLALGDSYTIGERVPDRGRWPMQLADSLRMKGKLVQKPVIIATTGWRTDDLENAISQANPLHDYDIVSLLIGVNDYFQGVSVEEYQVRFEKLLRTAVMLASGNRSHVVVISIPDYGFTPFGNSQQQEISDGIDTFNNANHMIAKRFGVHYVNVTEISRRGLLEPRLVADDGLHPSSIMYTEWVNVILKGILPVL